MKDPSTDSTLVIGIDVRPLQINDKYRGIGEVVKQITSRLLILANNDKRYSVRVVFFEYDRLENARKFIDIPAGLDYEICLQPANLEHKGFSLNRLRKHVTEMFGNPITGAQKCDVFLQFNYLFGIPSKTKSVLLKHDIIPCILGTPYLSPTMTYVRQFKPKNALFSIYSNFRYKQTLRRALKRTDTIITSSENTKNDLNTILDVETGKMQTIHLGVSKTPSRTYGSNSSQKPGKPYLFFVGGIDRRRQIEDLIKAFNSLKDHGNDIQLVLAGKSFTEPAKISDAIVRESILTSPYKEDILTLGYIDDSTKLDLYKQALAFVFPTLYEGFGIPILESMLMECPVITYKNSSIPEIGHDHPFYGQDWNDIKSQTEHILSLSEAERRERVSKAKSHAEQFTWDKTAHKVYQVVTS